MDGEYTINRTRGNVTEKFTVQVFGASQARMQDNIAALIQAVSQFRFTLRVVTDDATYRYACETGDYTLPQLYVAEEAFVTGTMGGLVPVLSVDGRTIGAGAPGPLTKRLTALYADLTASTGTPVA